ncbi:N-acetyl-gamma-glutamyl-phosphate reductase [Lactococcus cremoris]|uniref:N-acetyl-gamma-glutamyl-phosphate reductase n=1 Tax=Lactococcus lactis subsp. cremoris TaxID=1359 RepID=A0A1V0PHU2_LACLC|nr:N-acetyl-gamma-glutamyl-phosphate reductase [Lactococcus cremoris]ARE28857.1 N-acetyl-gamma-glutamyl-phosphate reductase [Lactococcus cremoris]EUN35482.1 N-acetyl-gamma-glutamyl-phosphate reductase ArgC [Lactococcus cremoris subsp. cremoris HP]KZK13520.1 N-acetyl-gamma-glutamyl-phosphate reductase [Lactococcus cremoris]KZK36144.1 N-acetyl-gamma-glutamyl-phosphate reductase [Lactococcus cremoris]KZK46926.1 N-acetyl-gamma-glutamyl-phosphate reductase [Lactococcus cremoris]
MKKIAIVGITGYSGLELLRIFYGHPEVEVAKVCATSHYGEKLSELFPQLENLTDLTVSEFNDEKIMAECDAVFFATSSGVSQNLALAFIDADFPVIDLSGDFRLNKAETYEKWYKNTNVKNEYLLKSEYHLADIGKASGNYIANPGCYATATLLALYPSVKNEMIDLNSIIVDAKSGLSGAGKTLSESSHFVNVADNMSMYKVNAHQHIPEIAQQLKIWNPNFQALQFSTSLIPVSRGIFVSTYAKVISNFDIDQIRRAYVQAFLDKPFVRIRRQMPQLSDVIGTNFCDIGLAYNPVTNVLSIVSVIDNLMKGAAGQAVQNFNQLFGYDESLGLNFLPRR